MRIIKEAQKKGMEKQTIEIELWGGPDGKVSFPAGNQGLGDGKNKNSACHKINNLVNQGGGNIVREWNDSPAPQETQTDWQSQPNRM